MKLCAQNPPFVVMRLICHKLRMKTSLILSNQGKLLHAIDVFLQSLKYIVHIPSKEKCVNCNFFS